jgi:hypothetical protein
MTSKLARRGHELPSPGPCRGSPRQRSQLPPPIRPRRLSQSGSLRAASFRRLVENVRRGGLSRRKPIVVHPDRVLRQGMHRFARAVLFSNCRRLSGLDVAAHPARRMDGYFLTCGHDYRFVLLPGNHRVAALNILGYRLSTCTCAGGTRQSSTTTASTDGRPRAAACTRASWSSSYSRPSSRRRAASKRAGWDDWKGDDSPRSVLRRLPALVGDEPLS